jgi:hypothetical protein
VIPPNKVNRTDGIQQSNDTVENRKQPKPAIENHRKGNSKAENKPTSDKPNRLSSQITAGLLIEPLDKGGVKESRQLLSRRVPKTTESGQANSSSKKDNMERANSGLLVNPAEREQKHHAERFQNERLKLELKNANAENERLKQERDSLESDNKYRMYFTNRYQYIVNNLILPYAQQKGLQYDGRSSESVDFVLQPLLQDSKKADELQIQVKGLQQELIERAGKTNATSDEYFAQAFRSLAGLVKTLSRFIELYHGVDVVETLEMGGLASGSVKEHWSGRTGNKRFIEAWTWSVLLDSVFANPFSIFGPQGQGANSLWMIMFGMDHCDGWPLPTSQSEDWRQATMEQLVSMVDQDIITERKTKTNLKFTEALMMEEHENIIKFIESGLARITPSVDFNRVNGIVDKAFALAMQMSLQRSRLQVTFPRIGSAFNKAEMSPVANDEDDDVQYEYVALVVVPGLTKWGNSHGKNLDDRYDIVRAMVQSEVPSEIMEGISLI